MWSGSLSCSSQLRHSMMKWSVDRAMNGVVYHLHMDPLLTWYSFSPFSMALTIALAVPSSFCRYKPQHSMYHSYLCSLFLYLIKDQSLSLSTIKVTQTMTWVNVFYHKINECEGDTDKVKWLLYSRSRFQSVAHVQ